MISAGLLLAVPLGLIPLAVAPAAGAPAEQPPLSNARLVTASAAGGLDAAVAAAGKAAAWIGWAVAKVPGDNQACCWNDGGRGCGLEGDRKAAPAAPSGPVKLEGPTHVAILLRVEQGAVEKIRSYATDCPLDAGGLPLHWLTGVNPAQSVALLLRHASAGDPAPRKSPADAATHAIALHAGADAQAALEKLATSAPSQQARKSAIFWLASTRGRPGYQVVSRLAREDPSEKLREHAVFALTQSREPEAIPTIVRIAREDRTPHVRGQALFWLAQKAASRQATEAISAAIDRDPETEVKKKAVFALTQLPHDAGVPLLVQLARTNTNPTVKKQAMFWLGQSKDPRALKFFEEVLSR